MTNYNERLDGIFHDLYLAGWNDKLLDDSPTAVPSENQEKRKAKQALTPLIKELVAEAKPGKYKTDGSTKKPNLAIEYNMAIDQFEQNLLKALEEQL